jgi:Glycosyltransferase family 87
VRLNRSGVAGSAAPSNPAGPAGFFSAGAFSADPARSCFVRVVCLVVAALGWANVAILGRAMLAQSPPAAGLDLELLLNAARRVAAGDSPYDPGAVAHGLQARDLFYSYPPFVAQVLTPLAGLPTWLVLTGWCLGAGAGLVLIAALLARAPIGRPATALPALSLDCALLAFAAAPLFFPFTIALLFGNVDAWFPLLFGAVVLTLASHGTAPSRATSIAGGVALAVASAVKLHPGTMVVWLAARRPAAGTRWPHRTVIAAVIATGISILAVSLLVGGVGPWRDYVDYLRLTAAADLASRVNIGPASQLALLAGDSGLARPLAVVFAGVAVVATIAVARLVRDPLESMSWAIVASLIVLPVTWYHYPVVLIPVALVAWTRSRGTARARSVTLALAAGVVVADVAIALPVAIWLAVVLLFVAVRRSRPQSGLEPILAAEPPLAAGPSQAEAISPAAVLP